MKRYLLTSATLIFFVSALVACSGNSGSGGNGSNGGTSTDPISTLADCSGSELFSTPPVALSDTVGIVPLGALNPPGHVFPTDHIYFYIRYNNPSDTASGRAEVQLYAPGNIRIISIKSSEHTTASPPYTNYTVYFAPCRNYKAYFDHVASLSDAVSSAAGSLDENCSTATTGGETIRSCTKTVSIDLSAGDAVGTAGGSNEQALDMGAYDSRIQSLAYANQSRYPEASDGFDDLHVVCPVDYFSTSAQVQMETLFGNYSGTTHRTIEPTCGEVMQDVGGTAQGNWFSTSEPDVVTDDPHLALVHDNVDPTKGAFSIGTTVRSYYTSLNLFTPASSGRVNLDFDLVTSDGNAYCYDNLTDSGGNPISDTILIIQMTSETTLKIERQSASSCGNGPWNFSSPSTFER